MGGGVWLVVSRAAMKNIFRILRKLLFSRSVGPLRADHISKQLE